MTYDASQIVNVNLLENSFGIFFFQFVYGSLMKIVCTNISLYPFSNFSFH
jgi:hypothetical protein